MCNVKEKILKCDKVGTQKCKLALDSEIENEIEKRLIEYSAEIEELDIRIEFRKSKNLDYEEIEREKMFIEDCINDMSINRGFSYFNKFADICPMFAQQKIVKSIGRRVIAELRLTGELRDILHIVLDQESDNHAKPETV